MARVAPLLPRFPRRPLLTLLPALISCALAAACGAGAEPPRAEPGATAGAPASAAASAKAAAPSLRETAWTAVEALAAGRFGELAELVHPARGVRFSPYAHVDPDEQVILMPEDLRAAARGETLERTWGRHDGSGRPIELPFRGYVERFVYDAPYLEEGRVAVDERQGRGNTLDNSAAAYPDARIVEYHVPGDADDGGEMAWRSLRLAFERVDGRWYLVGVIHDQWTI